MRNINFICCISAKHKSPEYKEVLRCIREDICDISDIWPNVSWNAPIEYQIEMGQNLETQIIILKNAFTVLDFVKIKTNLMDMEVKYSMNNNRLFNLNPGFIDGEGMFLITHKPNFERGRTFIGGGLWMEQQYIILNNQLSYCNNTFSEYLNKKRLKQFNKLFPKVILTAKKAETAIGASS
ncbi:MAG: DUF4416 family protein [Sphingobacteriales bacterium JAD_PAG50586_3]|nr:MAG: DUF4416 family protein [Sphingobacteriales bacterium JAD_PAG50586_3]